MPRWLTAVLVALVVALAGCASSSTSTGAGSVGVAAVPARPAGVKPSASAKMVCSSEAQAGIASGLGVKPTQVTTPTWVDHQYSCQYQYANGVISVSVKELNSAAETKRYFDGLAASLGRRPDRIALGQGAFGTTNGSVVARKDWKVLDIDVSQVPAQFGVPAQSPYDVALSVAATVMSCWSGA